MLSNYYQRHNKRWKCYTRLCQNAFSFWYHYLPCLVSIINFKFEFLSSILLWKLKKNKNKHLAHLPADSNGFSYINNIIYCYNCMNYNVPTVSYIHFRVFKLKSLIKIRTDFKRLMTKQQMDNRHTTLYRK